MMPEWKQAAVPDFNPWFRATISIGGTLLVTTNATLITIILKDCPVTDAEWRQGVSPS